jgi:sigma-B regulation protein RsbU (phosphoserine phosphatase)
LVSARYTESGIDLADTISMADPTVIARPVDEQRQWPIATGAPSSAPVALVAEDDAAERVRLAAIIEKMGFTALLAADGMEALAKIENFKPRLVISDWHMPRMSGLEMCQQLKKSSAADHTYFILVTGRNATSDLVAGLSAGADDFVAKPYDAAELRARVDAGRRIMAARAGLEDSNESLLRTLNVEQANQRRVQHDLDEAARLQTRLLPPANGEVGSFRIGRIFHSAEKLAGDVFGCFPIDDSVIGFFHVDVVGHGAAAALNSFAVARTLCTQSPIPRLMSADDTIRDPVLVVSDLNQQFLVDDRCDQYFTMIYGVLDSDTGDGRFCQAGHPHPLKLKACGAVEKLGTGGFPVALLGEADYTGTNFTLERGERLFFYSDGASEARDDRDEMYGVDRLANDMISTRKLTLSDSLGQLERSLIRWCGGRSWDAERKYLMRLHG